MILLTFSWVQYGSDTLYNDPLKGLDLVTSFRLKGTFDLDTSFIFCQVLGLGLEFINLGHFIDALRYLATPLKKFSVDQ